MLAKLECQVVFKQVKFINIGRYLSKKLIVVKVLTVTEAKSKLPVHFEHFCRVKEKNRQMTTSVRTIYMLHI